MFMRVPADDAAKEAERQELKVGMRQSAVQTKVKMSGLKDGNRLIFTLVHHSLFVHKSGKI